MFGGTTSTFGTPTFGQATGNVFGQQPQQNQLFSSANTSTFGTPAQNAFGSTPLFGQQNTAASTSLFGNTSTFGQQNKQPGYSFPTPQSGLFGQSATTQQPQQPSNMFQPSTSSNIFGASTGGFGMAPQTGTTIKFTPVTGTDSMQKSGSTTVINTKHHCITCMKEYENKSFEELRMEDYAANRKGPQAGSTSAFGATPNAQPFASSTGGGMFGQSSDPKLAFGQTSTSFGQAAPAFGSAVSSTPNLFGKPAFGSTLTTSTANTGFGGFGTPTVQQQPATNMFGTPAQPQQNKPFGQATPLFGSTQTQPAFGQTGGGFFGQNPAASQPQSSFFKSVQTTFTAPLTGGFAFGQQPTSSTAGTGLFQPPKTTGFSLFNTTTTTPSAGATGAWPATNTFGTNAFAKPAQPAFGQPTQSTFGTGLQMPQTNLFGMLGNKPAFGNTTGTSIFGSTNNQTAPSFGLQQPNMQQPVTLNTSTQLNDLRQMIAHSDPYGYSPHLDNLDSFKPSSGSGGTHYVTNPKDIDNYLKETENNISTTAPKSKKIQVKSPCAMEKWKMFESSYDADDASASPGGQTISKSIKRLNIPRNANLKKPGPIYVVKDGRLVETSTQGGNTSNGGTPIMTPPRALQISTSTETQSTFTQQKDSTATKNSQTTPDAQTSFNNSGIPSPQNEQDTSQGQSEKRNVGVVNIDTLGDASQQKFQSSADIPDTCGVICTRSQYYTLPALDKLAQFKNSDGTCLIEGFTIGRHGYGNVHFPDVIDVANLNIDQLVHFRHKQICIYLDDNTKPPVGEGLNRPAQVTLDRVFPSKDPGESEDAQNRAMAEIEFEEVLRRACVRAGTIFVDYRPETGSWVFKVHHFSKYDLLDPEEEEIRREALQGRKTVEAVKQKETESPPVVNQASQPRVEYEMNKSNDFESNASNTLHRGLGGAPKKATEPPRMTPLDSASFFPTNTTTSFGMHSMDEQPSRWEQDRVPKRNLHLMQMKYMFYNDERDKADEMIEGGVVDMDGVQSCFELSDQEQTTPDEGSKDDVTFSEIGHVKDRDWPDMFVLRNPSRRVPKSESLLVDRGVMDAAIFKGRGFKCGWGAGLKLLALTGDGRVSEVRVSPPVENEKETDPFYDHAHLNKFINLIYSETALQLDHDGSGDNIPFFQMIQTPAEDRYQTADGVSLLGRLFTLSEEMSLKYSRNKHMSYYHSIWKLMVAFWDAPKGRDSELFGPNVDHFRREMFNGWLEHVTGPIADRILGDKAGRSEHDNMLTCLSAHKINEAVKMAIRGDHPQLSMIISQLNACNMTRFCMQQQLNHWHSTGALEFVADDVRRMYMLAAGTITYAGINVLEGMDWLRCLGVVFWYICPSWRNVQVALATFEDAFEKRGDAAPPVSKYGTIQDTWDILYHLMQLYCNNQSALQILLSPQTHTSDPNDYRLSWLLQQVFLSMGVGLVSDECHYQTTTSFATQLEEYQQYKWSIFVLLHLKDTGVRKNLVMGVLDRQLGNMDADLMEHIVSAFRIPSSWMHQVLAARANLLGNHWQAFKHLSYSGQHSDSHELLMRDLVPVLVGNQEFDILSRVLEDMQDDRAHMTRWKYAGGLITQFIRFWRNMNIIQERRDVPPGEITAIHMELNQLLMHLRSFSISDHRQVMVVAEMSKYCASCYTTLLRHGVYEFNDQFNLLVMPFDYKYTEINKFIGHSRFQRLGSMD